jgi:SET domain-containing protein
LDEGVHADVEERPSPVAGRGLFATATIPVGTFVLRPEAPVHERGPVNHACDPNLGWAGDALVTVRDVAAGEELLVDYAMSTTDPDYLLRCHCASYRCRQMVEGTDWRIPQLQLRYTGHWAPHVQALIDATQTNSQA